MGKVLLTEQHLTDIASAIRSKNEESTRYKPGDMARAIRLIPTGGGSVLETLTVTENGLYTPDDGVDGYSTVTVSVSAGILPEDEGKVVQNGALTPQTSRTVTHNGTFDTTRNNQVTVNVSGGGTAESPTLVPLTVTENGTYSPVNDNADGYSSVTVEVDAAGATDIAWRTAATVTHMTIYTAAGVFDGSVLLWSSSAAVSNQ